MRTFRILVVEMAVIALFAIGIILFWDVDEAAYQTESFKSYNEEWKTEIDGTENFYRELPEEIDTKGTGQVILTHIMDENTQNVSCIGFYTSHKLVSAYVGAEKIYSIRPQGVMASKTPGNLWNFIELSSEYQGQEITIILTDCYGNGKMILPDFYYGTKDAIMMWHIKQRLMPLLLSMIILLIGLALVFVYFFARKTMSLNIDILWLGMFAILLGIWSGLESQIFTLFFPQILLISQVTFAVVKLLPIPLMQFVGAIYELPEDKMLKGLCILCMLDFWVNSALQLLGLFDYKQTHWVTMLICIICALYLLVCTLKILREKGARSRKSKHTILVHALCTGIILICTLLDTYRYARNLSMDAAHFSRLGFLVYIIVLSIQLLNDSVRLIRAGQQSERLKIEAETDVMTKLKNRRSFERDLYSLKNEVLEDYGVIVCDLNNLKVFNDVYGHSAGDYYIIICSEIIQDIFGRYGTVYRTGGDEFCGIVKNLEPAGITELRNEIRERIKALSGSQFTETMQVAVGYAKYDKKIDRSLSDTMERADESMYQIKKQMKEAARQRNEKSREEAD